MKKGIGCGVRPGPSEPERTPCARRRRIRTFRFVVRQRVTQVLPVTEDQWTV